MEKIWLKSYPEGVPADIDFARYESLVHLLEDAFRTHGSKQAFACMGKSITYAELDQLSRDFAAWLQADGIKPGSRVAVMMPNVLQYPVAVAGILRAGCILVNVNPLYTARELEHQLKDSGAEAIVILENFAHLMEKVQANTNVRHVVVAAMGDLLGGIKGAIVNFVVRRVKKMVPPFSVKNAISFKQALAGGRAAAFSQPKIGHEDVAVLQYTGGTTGVAKGATLVHRNLIANVLQSEAWMQPAFQRVAPGEQMITITALPLYHIFAFTVCGMLSIRNGGLSVLIPNPRDFDGFIEELTKYKFHLLPAVNTLYNALANHPNIGKVDFSKLIISNGGGMAVQEAVAQKWLKVTGCPVVEGYGLSETSPSATCNPVNSDKYSGTIGLPLPSTEIAIRDDEGKDVPLGQPGEICIRGPQVMKGYWNRPDETAKVMTPDGFLRTGDVGVMEPTGHVKVVDRKKDMILVSGFNVYPNEIESVVAMHPGVLECAAIGVPDQYSGEAVKLIVVKKDPALTAEQVQEFCKEQLTGYKRPKYVEFRTELPKTPVGKILRRELRDAA